MIAIEALAWVVSASSRGASHRCGLGLLVSCSAPAVSLARHRGRCDPLAPDSSGRACEGSLPRVRAFAPFCPFRSRFRSSRCSGSLRRCHWRSTTRPVQMSWSRTSSRGARHFDEFPVSSLMLADGAIDATRYPNFARLAREATWYPHATSANETTTQAVPAILTGISSRHPGLPTLADHPDNLFTLLGWRYTLRVTEEVTRLCPIRYCPQTACMRLSRSPERPVLRRRRRIHASRVAGVLAGELPPIGDRWGGSAIPRIRIQESGCRRAEPERMGSNRGRGRWTS